jgi:hypothetical protein
MGMSNQAGKKFELAAKCKDLLSQFSCWHPNLPQNDQIGTQHKAARWLFQQYGGCWQAL